MAHADEIKLMYENDRLRKALTIAFFELGVAEGLSQGLYKPMPKHLKQMEDAISGKEGEK